VVRILAKGSGFMWHQFTNSTCLSNFTLGDRLAVSLATTKREGFVPLLARGCAPSLKRANTLEFTKAFLGAR